MPTGATGWSGPDGWAEMAVTADHSAQFVSFPIGWTWTGGDTAVLGTSHATGTGIFGFAVYKNVTGPLSINSDNYARLTLKPRYRVVVTNPADITAFTLPRLVMELQALSWASANKLPYVGSKFFDGSFGTATGMSNLTRPIVTNVQYDPENEKDPSVWLVTYTVSARERTNVGPLKSTGEEATKPNIDEAPWTTGADIKVDFSTEDFVLGLGKFIGAKTPAELDAALADESYASVFGATGGTFEMVVNSAGDPLESPPPMKVGTASISISRSFEELPAGLTDKIKLANAEVCSATVTVNGVEFGAYTCKLNGAGVSNKRFKMQCDWLPKQVHPLGHTFADLGWTPPKDSGYTASSVAVNYTRNTLPAFTYVDYLEVTVSIAQRDLGWGYALVDKGYRDANKKDLGDFSARQTHATILAEGVEVDLATGTTDKKVLRLYQVLRTGTALSDVMTAMLA